ncbi:MAG: MBL fold metallo-hydrolase [Clostridium butyricum]|mgnify:FL=1|jgi:metallo-beta-lactamase class B|nr:MAG: hypothetical protein Q607_CBUC00199G0008 [Clostridium butyricum DORA_1]MDU1007020.1 MBL fold metallo-hydrolase [Clostridium butyricum]MDU1510244.1 MBL fold metallo-hydrolase [Clostridium butyricum]
MLNKVTKILLSAVVVSMSISALAVFSLRASAETKDSSIAETAADNNDDQKKQSGGPPALIMNTTPIEPTKVFDNLYFIGTEGVGVWLVNTSDGLILIDSMNNAEDAENIIIPGIRKLGFNPEDIKYVLITHGHGDHYGGAQYIADNYGSSILMSALDWEYMETHFTYQCGPEFPKPISHTDITDGQKLTLGDTTITIIATPGHSPGGVSLIIPVTDNGTKHMVGMWGGTGLPRTIEENQDYLNSLNYFAEFTDAAQVDVEITAHTAVDNSAERLRALQNRKDGDPNPFVIGEDAYKDYMNNMVISVNENINKINRQSESAQIAKGWSKTSDGKWIYSENSNSLLTNTWKKIDIKWYYFNSSSEAVIGWQYINGEWYYFDSSNEAVTGWKEINNTWYYFDESCAMVHDCYVGQYYLSSSGAMI